MLNQSKFYSKQTHNSLLIFCLTGLIISRLLPLFRAPISAYGYDYGFYLDTLKHIQHIPWSNIFTTLTGGFSNPLFFLFHTNHLPAELTLSLSYLFFSLLTGLTFYLFFYPHNKTAGLFALLLFSLSLVQMESYIMFLYKNAFALPWLILGLKFLNEKQWKLFSFFTLLILLSHRTTAIIYAFTIAGYCVYSLIHIKRYKTLGVLLIGSGLLLTTYYLRFGLPIALVDLLHHNNTNIRSGLFFGTDHMLIYIWPYLPLAIAGIIKSIKNKTNSLLLIFTTLCLIWIIFYLPFYRRIWIYFDIGLIIFSAYFLSTVNWQKHYFKIALTIIFLFFCLRFGEFTWAKNPLISRQEIQELKTFNALNGFILAVSANDAPWLLAFTNGFRLGAPGLLEDPHTYEEWQSFWQGHNQRHFISYYPRPLYIYERDWKLPNSELTKCLIPISKNFYEVDFNCVEKY